MLVQYKPVSWSAGEAFVVDNKLRQMIENDEVIQSMLLSASLGLIAEQNYLDVEGGTSLTAGPGNWTTIILIENVYIQPSRWIKISATLNRLFYTDTGTYIPARVTMDGDEILYMRTAPGDFSGTHESDSLTGARIMQSVPGYHTFALEIGNDQAGVSGDTSLVPVGPLNPTILAIEDMGGNDA